jgi:hypothetical protein
LKNWRFDKLHNLYGEVVWDKTGINNPGEHILIKRDEFKYSPANYPDGHIVKTFGRTFFLPKEDAKDEQSLVPGC